MPASPMLLALTQAEFAKSQDEVPIGCVIVSPSGEILAETFNLVERHRVATAHAEMLAIKSASEKLGQKFLDGCDLYVTLEPCSMCAGAISLARIRRVYFGAYDPKTGGVEHGSRVFSHSTCHHKPEVYGGIEEEKCCEMLRNFFQSKRGCT